MNLNEAFRYLNFLDKLMDEIEVIMLSENQYYKIIEHHLRSKYNPNAVDEIIEVDNDKKYTNKSIEEINKIALEILNERQRVNRQIFNSKNNIIIKVDDLSFDIDTAIDYAKRIRHYAKYILESLSKKKKIVNKQTQRDYMINVNNEQVEYNYICEILKDVNYDKESIKNIYKMLLTKADKISIEVDKALLYEIDFEPKFNIHDGIIDIIEKA